MQTGFIKKKLNIVGVMYLLMVAAVTFTVCFIVVTIRKNVYEDDSVTQDGLYDFTINDTQYDPVVPSEFFFDTADRGTVIKYSTTLIGPELDNPVLTLYIVHSLIDVYLDDEQVYTYGDKSWRMPGYGYVNVELPDDYAGKRLTVVQTVMEPGEISTIYAPVVYNARNQLHNLLDSNYFYLVLDIALVVLSITIMLISAFFMNIMPALRSLIALAVSFCCMGIWEMCSYNIIWIFSDSLMLRGYMEYVSLYMAPFFFTLYFFGEFYRKEKSGLRNVYLAILTAQGIFPVAALILHFADIVHLPKVLSAGHILMFGGIAFILVMLVRQIIRKEATHKALVFGLIILIGLGISDIIRFNIFRYMLKSSQVRYTSYLLLGFFVFMIAMVIDFFLNQRKDLFNEAENQALSRMAYVDMLTNLANRRRCEDMFDNLVQSSEVFGIVSFDMNGLKPTNDKYGHIEGDRLLVDFANLLQSVFGKYGVVGRMGGDEFIVILPGVDHIQFEMAEQELDEKRREINLDRQPMPLSFAYGYCRSDDNGLKLRDGSRMSVNEVYRLADERMYVNKAAMKKNTVSDAK